MDKKKTVRLANITNLGSNLYLMTFDDYGLNFTCGQHISLNIKGEDKARVYSIASGENDEQLQVLIREITNGDLSKRLRQLECNTLLELTKPVGYFCLPEDFRSKKVFCIATGSGVAPFRSFAKTHPDYAFTVVHGIRSMEDSVADEFNGCVQYITCTSKSNKGDFQGRVTDYVALNKIDKEAYYFLCGNGEMIHELYNYLKNSGVSRTNINYEEYYNN